MSLKFYQWWWLKYSIYFLTFTPNFTTMKTLFSFFLLFGVLLQAQVVNIPDPLFKAKLLEADTTNEIAKDLSGNFFKIDANSDGEIQVSEAEMVSYLNTNRIYDYINDYYNFNNHYELQSIEGIESFLKLKEYYVLLNGKFLAVLQNISSSEYVWKMGGVYSHEEDSTLHGKIIVKNCPNLVKLSITGKGTGTWNYFKTQLRENVLEFENSNNLQELDLNRFYGFNSIESTNPNSLKKLTITFSGENILNLTKFQNLEEINSNYPSFYDVSFQGGKFYNGNFTFIDASGLENLKQIKGFFNLISAQDCINLEYIGGSIGGDFSSLSSWNLGKLHTFDNTAIINVYDALAHPKDGKNSYISNDQITSLSLENLPSLKYFDSSTKLLESINLNTMPILESLSISANEYTSNDNDFIIKDNFSLKNLTLSLGGLESIDIKQNPLLDKIYIGGSPSIDIKQNPLLDEIYIHSSRSTDIQYNPELKTFKSSGSLGTLNLSNNDKLSTIDLGYSTIEKFYANNLPSLKKLNLFYDGPELNNYLIYRSQSYGFDNNAVVEINGTDNLEQLSLGYSIYRSDSSGPGLLKIGLPKLTRVDIFGGDLKIDLENSTSLNSFHTINSKIKEITFGNNVPLDVSINDDPQFSGFDQVSLDYIKGAGIKNIRSLNIKDNVTNVITTGFDNLETLRVRGVKGKVDTKGSPLLKRIGFSWSDFESLDLSNNTLGDLSPYPPVNFFTSNVKEMNLKNKNLDRNIFSFYNNPNFPYKDPSYICADEFEIEDLKKQFPNSVIDTKCTDSNPPYNTIKGKIKIANSGGAFCTNESSSLGGTIKISSSDEKEFDPAILSGEYSFYSFNEGKFTIKPKENVEFLPFEPVVVNFPDTNYNTFTQDFCLVPNYNTIIGKVKVDLGNNNCTSGYELLTNHGVNKTDSNNIKETEFTNYAGEYNLFAKNAGNFTVQPLPQSNLFNAEPIVINFDGINITKTQDFCLKPNGTKNDVEVTVIPETNARPGEEANYKLVYKNKGNTTLSGKIDFMFDEPSLDFKSASVVPVSTIGHLSWNYTNLKPFEQKEISLTMKLNSPQDTPPLVFNDVLKYGVAISPNENDQTLDDNTFTLKQTVVGSFDPNDKTCLQGNIISHEMVGNYVDYLIRFQNMGTDFARNIVIKDLIDTNKFEVESFTPVSSSHPYRLTITEGNKVEYFFENIKLPGNYNEPNSHGYVSFKIKTKPSVVIGDELKNLANIYFDYNDPIETNEAKSLVANIQKDEVIIPFDYDPSSAVTFTNPAKDILTFDREVKSVTLYDMQGKILQTSLINSKEMNVSYLKPGVYILEMITKEGKSTGKLIKE
jgi:hypothetical protein